ncbi:MAG: Kae1-associated serine/threonine protein kinase [Candidatus Diapherotrites archaeon]|uniref:non-specific serine/threonine protein kinase n=1 Tax=Candidatus Iainarchaeum sp. TaxID=3101447 RepID=A0A8T3YLT8_9ARCH|nr:Kae1-associated serine/threonine protein kinase [Candidatus Diapherotrites archaeon]
MKMLAQGAEAKLYLSEYLGKKCIVKVRQNKAYREKALDRKIITERLRAECNLVSRAKSAGVRTPLIYKVDIEGCAITFEFLEGTRLKEGLLMAGSEKAGMLCAEFGKTVAKLHSAGIVHFDLTTSNAIMHNGKIALLDFGLGEVSARIEDMAVDILALKRTFMATHYRHAEGWRELEEAYSANFQNGHAALRQVAEIEARARYY